MALIHWWPLNGDTKDYGIDSNPLTRNTNATINNNGKIGKCYYFNGNAFLAWETNTNSCQPQKISVAAWVNFTAVPTSSKAIIECFEGGGVGMFGDANGNVGFQVYTNTYYSVRTPLSTGWHHYVGTWDGTALKIYIDGVLKATTNVGNSTLYYHPTTPWMIGSNPQPGGSSGGDGFTGYINDMRIYDHVLSLKEIKEISKGLVLHYDFEDGEIEGTTNLFGGRSDFSNTSHWSRSQINSTAPTIDTDGNMVLYGARLYYN